MIFEKEKEEESNSRLLFIRCKKFQNLNEF